MTITCTIRILLVNRFKGIRDFLHNFFVIVHEADYLLSGSSDFHNINIISWVSLTIKSMTSVVEELEQMNWNFLW